MTLSRDQILKQSAKLKRVEVEVEEWGGKIIISEMTGTARDNWDQWIGGKKDGELLENVRARLVVLTAVDKEGNRLFRDADIDEVGKLSAKALQKCFRAAQKINGLSDEDLEDAKKNSETGLKGSSTSS